MLNVKINKELFDGLESGQVERGLKAAASRAINRSARSSVALGARQIAKATKLKISSVKAMMRIRNSKPNDLKAYVLASGGRVFADQLSPRERVVRTARGPRRAVTIVLAKKRTLIPGAFMGRMKNGKLGVFNRRGSRRLPIDRTRVTSKFLDLIDRYGAEGSAALATMHRHAQERILKESEAEVRHLARRLRERKAASFRSLDIQF